jgi:hypothetical protein
MAPLAPVLRGEGLGVRGSWKPSKTPHSQPFSPEYRGEEGKTRSAVHALGLDDPVLAMPPGQVTLVFGGSVATEGDL